MPDAQTLSSHISTARRKVSTPTTEGKATQALKSAATQDNSVSARSNDQVSRSVARGDLDREERLTAFDPHPRRASDRSRVADTLSTPAPMRPGLRVRHRDIRWPSDQEATRSRQLPKYTVPRPTIRPPKTSADCKSLRISRSNREISTVEIRQSTPAQFSARTKSR